MKFIYVLSLYCLEGRNSSASDQSLMFQIEDEIMFNPFLHKETCNSHDVHIAKNCIIIFLFNYTSKNRVGHNYSLVYSSMLKN